MSDPKASAGRPKIIGVGLVSLDFVVSTTVRSWAGGTCGNIMAILSYLGWDAYLVARLDTDAAGARVRADMARWGVRLDFAGCGPTLPTPIIIEEIRRRRDGTPNHRFLWSCPHCGSRLPRFRPVTLGAAAAVLPIVRGASAFFMDRVSPAALALATRASAEGAVVVFEPSSPGDPDLFAAAIRIAHVVKYAAQLLPEMPVSNALLEVQTLGEQGLRYRYRSAPEWIFLAAVPAARLVDACGAGDWCTAGLVAKLAAGGQAGLRQDGVRDALRYGQALAARNCGFEGARGGMYAADDVPEAVIACPGCRAPTLRAS